MTHRAVYACAVILAMNAVADGRAQSVSFDGVYRGEATTGSGCSVLHPTLRVAKGVASLRYNPNLTFEGSVGAGGDLDAPLGQGRLSGRFSDGKFQGSVSNGRCQYILALTK